MNAGADGFLAKPVENLAAFQAAILDHLPVSDHPATPRSVTSESIKPDRMAYRDDLASIETVLTDDSDDSVIDYAARFVSGIACSADDRPLQEAAEALTKRRAIGHPLRGDISRLADMVNERLAAQAGI